jgi:SNF2 family DNA or RNA helicase
MGLGKTLSMISLIAANQAGSEFNSADQFLGPLEYRRHINAKTTLLVVPPPRRSIQNSRHHLGPSLHIQLFKHGKSNFKCMCLSHLVIAASSLNILKHADLNNSHLLPDEFRINVFHGQNRKSSDLLGGHDIIITTFQTVSSIWRKQTEEHGDPDLLFLINWHRIILDEG